MHVHFHAMQIHSTRSVDNTTNRCTLTAILYTHTGRSTKPHPTNTHTHTHTYLIAFSGALSRRSSKATPEPSDTLHSPHANLQFLRIAHICTAHLQTHTHAVVADGFVMRRALFSRPDAGKPLVRMRRSIPVVSCEFETTTFVCLSR